VGETVQVELLEDHDSIVPQGLVELAGHLVHTSAL
jgi:hypothetical protein